MNPFFAPYVKKDTWHLLFSNIGQHLQSEILYVVKFVLVVAASNNEDINSGGKSLVFFTSSFRPAFYCIVTTNQFQFKIKKFKF